MRIHSLVVAVFLLMVLPGCVKLHPGTPTQQTRNKLRMLAEAAKAIDFNTTGVESFVQFYHSVTERGILADTGESRYRQDAWGKEFILNVEKDRKRVRITSAGSNGVFENGKGDDLETKVVVQSR